MIHTSATGWPSVREGGDWSADYPHVRRLLFGALCRLAVDGFAVPPGEGLDLIHDFLLEAWDGLAERYDPRLAGRDTYVYAAFLRFARPRIGRLRRLQAGLAAPSEIAAMLDGAAQADAEGKQADAALAWSVLERQPPPHRDILVAYLSDDGATERRLAADFHLTRYELRLRLADAVGRAAVALSDTAGFPEEDRAIAEALWRDNRTPKETAALFQTSLARVNEARQRAFTRLVAASRSIPSRKEAMRTAVKKPPIAGLLVSALRPGATDREIAALAHHREEVLNWLDEHADDLPLDAQPDAAQLARVYAALGGEAPEGADDPFRASRRAGDEGIGEAFADVLLPNLPSGLRDVAAWFVSVDAIDAEDVAALREEPSVVAGGETAWELAAYGITPVAVAVAGQALAALASRTAEASGIAREGTLVWEVAEGRGARVPGAVPLRRPACIREVGLAAELPDGAAASLHDWLGAVAAYAPRLLDGFEAEPWAEDAIVLTRTDRFTSDLVQRWRGPDEERARTSASAA